MKPTSFILVHLQRVEAESIYTTPLTAAFKDVERLYRNWSDGAVEFDSVYLAPFLATDDLRRQPRIDWGLAEQLLKTDSWWGGPRRRVFKVEQTELLPRVRKLVHARPDAAVVVAVGANISAPAGWSFGLWDVLDDHNAVVSLTPLNPLFWGFKDEGERMDRVKLVSMRARAAMCAVVGRCLGLVPCSNPVCFLQQGPISAIDQLDEMRGIGPEHEKASAHESPEFGPPPSFPDSGAESV